MTYTLAINVVETEGHATPGIVPSETSVAGFVIRSRRGPLKRDPIRVTNWLQFVEQFGGFVPTGGDPPTALGPYAVKGFFENGGSVAWVTRVANRRAGATPAALTTSGGNRRFPSPGTLTFKVDSATISVSFGADAAKLVADHGETIDLGAEPAKLTLEVNGVSQQHIFTAAEVGGKLAAAKPDLVADVLNREFFGMQVYLGDGGKLTLRTDRRGQSASLKGVSDVGSATANGKVADLLKLKSAEGTGTVQDLDAVTPKEVAALVNDALAASSTQAEASVRDNQVVIEHKEPGSGHVLQVVAGGASDSVHEFLGFDTVAHPGTDNLDDVGKEVVMRAATPARFVLRSGAEELTLTAAYRGSEDPGAWANELRVGAARNRKADLFDLVVEQQRAPGIGEWTVLETIAGLPRADVTGIARAINDPEAGSRYVKVTSPLKSTLKVPEPAGNESAVVFDLSDGTDDVYPSDDEDALLNADLKEGIGRFDKCAIQLLCCPESHAKDVTLEGIDACARRGDRTFVGHLAGDWDVATAVDAGADLKNDKVYGALYYPWITVTNPADGKRVTIPPDGHVLGVYARTATERGVWKAPAGNAARLSGVLDVRERLDDRDLTLLAREGGVNGIRFQPGQGIVVASSRTLSTNPLWWYVNVRLLFNFVKASLRDSLTWTVQEPNTPELRAKVVHGSVLPFLRGLALAGAFGSVIGSYTAKCDDENNPPATVAQGLLVVEVYFYPSRPAETIVIKIGQQDGAATASES